MDMVFIVALIAFLLSMAALMSGCVRLGEKQ